MHCCISFVRTCAPIIIKPTAGCSKKEFQVLLCFVPVTACSTLLFAGCSVHHLKLDLPSFIHLQPYNILFSSLSIARFGFFVNTRPNPVAIDKRKEKNASLLPQEEQRAQAVLQILHEAMETQQLYLSP